VGIAEEYCGYRVKRLRAQLGRAQCCCLAGRTRDSADQGKWKPTASIGQQVGSSNPGLEMEADSDACKRELVVERVY
jgi:hypothetical protein